MSAHLDPDAVTRTLGLMPTWSHRRGDSRGNASPRLSGVFAEGLWSYQTESQGSDLPSKLLDLVWRLVPANLAALRDAGHRMDILIGLFVSEGTGGIELPPKVTKALAEREIPLGISIYVMDDEE
jgi:hypothetical protein